MVTIFAVLVMLKSAIFIFFTWRQWRALGCRFDGFVICAVMTALDAVVIKACYAILTRGGI